MSDRRRIDVSQVGEVTMVRFIDRKIEDPNVHELGTELFDLVEKENRRSVVLNFTHVEFLSSAARQAADARQAGEGLQGPAEAVLHQAGDP